MADTGISWIEIIIAISVSILLILTGCLVLGLHVQSLSKRIDETNSNIKSSLDKVNDENSQFKYILTQSSSNVNVQTGQLKKTTDSMSTKLDGLSNLGVTNMSNIDTQLKYVNDRLSKFQNGSTPFSSIAIQDSYIKVVDESFRLGGKNNMYLDAKKLFLNSNSCLLFGSNEICSTSNELRINKDLKVNHINADNISLKNLKVSSSNNIVKFEDEKGKLSQFDSSGINHKDMGPMIDYNGNGIGKFKDAMRMYVPGNSIKNKIALSYYENDEFKDILSAQKSFTVGSNDLVTVMGDLTITGSIYNANMAQAIDKINKDLLNLKNSNTKLKQDLLKLQLKRP